MNKLVKEEHLGTIQGLPVEAESNLLKESYVQFLTVGIHCRIVLLVCGAVLLWGKGQNANSQQDLLNIQGAMFFFVQLTGIGNCSVLPFIAMERNVVYRERFAGMWFFGLAQLIIETLYIFVEALLFTAITYPAIGFYASTYKLFWYFYSMFCTLLYFDYFGMMLVSLSSTYQVASVWENFSYTTLNLVSGYLTLGPRIPVWWRWGFWTCPTTWTVKGRLALQYGDIMTDITVSGGGRATISGLLGSYLGYDHVCTRIFGITYGSHNVIVIARKSKNKILSYRTYTKVKINVSD